jgi:hypothetical protein
MTGGMYDGCALQKWMNRQNWTMSHPYHAYGYNERVTLVLETGWELSEPRD